MAPQDTCNAVEKKGSRVLICELPMDHDVGADGTEHQMGEEMWSDRGGW